MTYLQKNAGRFAAGTTLGGALIGTTEALYRDVALTYSALLYGALWALAGMATALALMLFVRARRARGGLLTWGFGLALSSSAVILIRYALVRDVFDEAPGWGWVALVVAVLCGALLLTTSVGLGRWVRHRFVTQTGRPGRAWAWPMLACLGFLLCTLDGGRDSFPSNAAADAAQYRGEGVIFIVADTLRADALGAYGAGMHRDEPISPHFDALAAEGTLFMDSSAQASWTKPTMASIMTSRHVSGHNTMSKQAVLPDSLPTVASVLQDAGVKTAAVVTNYNLEAGYGFARGFDEFHYLSPNRYLGAPPRANRLAAYNVYRLLRERFFKNARQPNYFYQSGQTVNNVALDVLSRIGDERFFMWLHYMEPHDPYFDIEGRSWARVSDPHPPQDWAGVMHKAYRDDVRRFDVALGELVQALQARGLYDRVTLVVTADHGEEFAEHGGYYHGTSLYEEQLHVPLLIRVPGQKPARVTTLSRQIDLAPTILARYGSAAPESWEGSNLLDPGIEMPVEALAEEDHEGHQLASYRRQSDDVSYKIIVANEDNPRDLGPLEFYDLIADPDEQAPLRGDTEQVASLEAGMSAMQRRSKEGAATPTDRPLSDDAEEALRSLGYVQ